MLVIYLNDLSNNICIAPVTLIDKLGLSQMKMTSTESNGKKLRAVFELKIVVVSMEGAVANLSTLQPDYIKLDVDGAKQLIPKGGREVLNNIKGIFIGVNDTHHQKASGCQLMLNEAGLALKEKCQSEMVSCSTIGFQTAYNQIWFRPAVSILINYY